VINAENMMAQGKPEGGEMEEFEKDAPASRLREVIYLVAEDLRKDVCSSLWQEWGK
jgi:hypothetical protein